MIFIWNDLFGEGVMFFNNSVFVEICFDVVGMIFFLINFFGIFILIELLDVDGNEVGFNSNSGVVIIGLFFVNSIFILWDEEGVGLVSFNFWYVNVNGCDVFLSIDFCFDVILLLVVDFII